jgi:hypothetical protein
VADPAEVLAGIEPAGFNHLVIIGEHAAEVVKLPPIHKDPFDRLLVAQARVEPMILLRSSVATETSWRSSEANSAPILLCRLISHLTRTRRGDWQFPLVSACSKPCPSLHSPRPLDALTWPAFPMLYR